MRLYYFFIPIILIVLTGCVQSNLVVTVEATNTGLEVEQRVNVVSPSGLGEASFTQEINEAGETTKTVESRSVVSPNGFMSFEYETEFFEGKRVKTTETRSLWFWYQGPGEVKTIEQDIPDLEVPKLPPGQLQL